MKKFLLLSGFLILSLGGAAYSAPLPSDLSGTEVQDVLRNEVKGTVTDAKGGHALAGVAVVVDGTARGVITDAGGKYSIKVSEGEILKFTSIGYRDVNVPITSSSSAIINVTMEEDALALQETVVIGYAVQKKVNLTGAVGTVNVNELLDRPVMNAVEALQGTTPGLIIEQSTSAPGETPSINIRGINTMNDNAPLVIIDGIEGDIQNVNVNDIQDISVLKDASSTAIYGSRASNGIILITTKRGDGGKNEINYNFNYGWQSPTALPNVVDSWIYADMYNEAMVNSGNTPKFSAEEVAAFKNGGPNYKWLDEIYQTSPTQQHSLSASGGNKTTTYLISGSYLDQDSMWIGPDYGLKQYNARLNLSHDVKSYLKLSATASYTLKDVNTPSKYNDQIVRQSVRMPPFYPVKDENGDWTTPSGSNSNAVARLMEGGYVRDLRDDLNGTIKAELKIFKGLTLSAMAGARYNTLRRHDQAIAIDYPTEGAGDAVNSKTKRYESTFKLTTDVLLNYSNTFGKHSISAIAGYSYEGQSHRWSKTGRTNLEDMKYEEFGDELSGDTISNSSNGNDWSLYSILGRINYNYDERYLFEFNIRNDRSSKFKKGYNSGVFPSLSLGWRISEEDFFAAAKKYIPNLKLRGSWGLVGNNRIDNYKYQAVVSVGNDYMFGGQLVPTSSFSLANETLRWETTRMMNVGLDMGFMKNNLTLSFDFFDNLTRDILVDLPVPSMFDGSGTLMQNAGKVRTYGWELAIGYKFNTGPVMHNISANISDSQNVVVDNKGKVDISSGDFVTIIKEGYPLWSYYGYESDGFFQNDEEVVAGPIPTGKVPKPGDIRYVDQNNDGDITEDDDRVVIGNRYPRYVFGFNYSLTWKGLDFAMFWQGVGKRDVWLAGCATQAFANNFEGPVFDYHLDRWLPGNPDATYPRLTMGAESANNALKSDFWLENAAYLRLKNLQLGYTFPKKWTSKIKIEKLRVYASVQNAFTVSGMRGGWDPEVSQNNASIYPVSRVVSLGLNVKF